MVRLSTTELGERLPLSSLHPCSRPFPSPAALLTWAFHGRRAAGHAQALLTDDFLRTPHETPVDEGNFHALLEKPVSSIVDPGRRSSPSPSVNGEFFCHSVQASWSTALAPPTTRGSGYVRFCKPAPSKRFSFLVVQVHPIFFFSFFKSSSPSDQASIPVPRRQVPTTQFWVACHRALAVRLRCTRSAQTPPYAC